MGGGGWCFVTGAPPVQGGGGTCLPLNDWGLSGYTRVLCGWRRGLLAGGCWCPVWHLPCLSCYNKYKSHLPCCPIPTVHIRSSGRLLLNPCNMCGLYVSRSDHFHDVQAPSIAAASHSHSATSTASNRSIGADFNKYPSALVRFPPLLYRSALSHVSWKKSLIGGLESVLNGVARRMQSVLDPIINYGECVYAVP